MTAYDFDYNRPLQFAPDSKDLYIMRNKEGVETKVLREPIPVLTAVMAAIADPFLTAPLMIKSTGEGLIENTSLISGLMHASPPSFVGMAYVFGQPSIARQYKSAKDFLMTEI